MASGRSWQIKNCDIIRRYSEGLESPIYENDREATVRFPVIFIMLPCHTATEAVHLRGALLHQSEVPVTFDFEGVNGEGGGKELGLIL